MYLITTPQWFKWIYPSLLWRVKTGEKVVYLTFDDGPHPSITPFILDTLKQYNAKATFFCLGKNVKNHFEIYRRIIDENHRVGNHTYNHKNGWKTKNKEYLNEVKLAAELIDSNLFRPPYGRISPFVARVLREKMGMKIVMWDVLSADFDQKINDETCYLNVITNVRPGSIVVFHDSEKAWPLLSKTLPRVLDYFSKEEYRFEVIK